MFKKVLAVALFAALLLSMIPAVSAADEEIVKPTAVTMVAVGNYGDADVMITPLGDRIGSMIPAGGYAKDRIVLKGLFENVINKTFTLAIVLNGQLDNSVMPTNAGPHDVVKPAMQTVDRVTVNGANFDISKTSNYSVLSDGRGVLWIEFSVQDWARYFYRLADGGSGMSYTIKFMYASDSEFTYEFDVAYENASYSDYDLLAGYSQAALDVLNAYPAKPNALPKPPVVAGNLYTVTASVLNVRATAAGKIIDKLVKGDVVEVVELVGNWAKIVSDDGTEYAYVYTSYLKAY